MNKNRKIIFLALIVAVIGFIIYDSTSQPTVDDLEGNFVEVASFRNENNKGPIVRIYNVSVEGPVFDKMKKYGDMMPYTKYGTTTVYFFDASKPVPNKLVQNKPNFDPEFNENCYAVYIKDQNGGITFQKSPF
ncbi:hypothetical protein LXM25_00605 [Dyadobacter sp. LJ53]|uniref:hypothetical protein n=1 Tax=Dyadobacter chenwenxiniae TaxID=2906456 RepID=UPI001F3FB240|nr:hypothetical protein [Dyadobacter chenwenxiniae]MCF0048532.1 hypothetical protein [Dyadobacter chenwenxiniae]